MNRTAIHKLAAAFRLAADALEELEGEERESGARLADGEPTEEERERVRAALRKLR